MTWDLPIAVEIDGKKYAIRNKCDYRVVLDAISALKDEDLDPNLRVICALEIFYEDLNGCKNIQKATDEMMTIINVGNKDTSKDENKPVLMDWEKDINLLAPPISRVLGYSVRSADNFTHFFDFVGAYLEIGECTFASVVSIRNKRAKGKPLESWEREFFAENKDLVLLPQRLSEEDEAWLDMG